MRTIRNCICTQSTIGHQEPSGHLLVRHPARVGPEGEVHLEAVDQGQGEAVEGVEPVAERSVLLVPVRFVIPAEMPFTFNIEGLKFNLTGLLQPKLWSCIKVT